MNPLGLLLDFLFSIVDKIALNWVTNRKKEDAIEEQNKVASLSDSAIDSQLRNWIKPD